jgi:hypothetical protein
VSPKEGSLLQKRGIYRAWGESPMRRLNLKEIYSDRIILFHEVAHPPAGQARNVAQSNWPGLISPLQLAGHPGNHAATCFANPQEKIGPIENARTEQS